MEKEIQELEAEKIVTLKLKTGLISYIILVLLTMQENTLHIIQMKRKKT